MKGKSRTEIVNRLGIHRNRELLPLKLHSDFDQIKWVSGTAGDDGSNTAFNETFKTHYSNLTDFKSKLNLGLVELDSKSRTQKLKVIGTNKSWD
ncbi:hypothetical protein O6P43_019575 [Quillaja saponaria]|uniref:Uncharacterized protein n=1 Tax=Quillaja saponaria TaxID=32244 RepID=A0AAD7PKY8_QUISA|nr:hypothetical protein O6P43_019575 [Quillaja saponaria]